MNRLEVTEVVPLMAVVVVSVLVAAMSWPSARVPPPPPASVEVGRSRPHSGPGFARLAASWSAATVSLRRGAGQELHASQVADALVLTALTVRAGLGLAEALAEVHACSRGGVRRDLGVVVAALRWGRPAGEAWRFAGPAWRDAALAWQVAATTGAPPAELLEQAARRLRDGQEREAERRAARAGVLLVLPLGLGFLPAFACTAVVPVVVALAGGVLRG